MLPVDQNHGKVAIFKRLIFPQPYISIAIWRPISFAIDIGPCDKTIWREDYEAIPVYMGPVPRFDPEHPFRPPPPPFYAYATSRDELDRFFERRNAEADAKRDPPPRADKAGAIDAYVVGEEPGLVKVARPRVHWRYANPDRDPRPPGRVELREVQVREPEREALPEPGLHRLRLPGKEPG